MILSVLGLIATTFMKNSDRKWQQAWIGSGADKDLVVS